MKLNNVITKTPEQANFDYLVWDIAWFGLAHAATSRFLTVYAIRSGASPAEVGFIASFPAIGMLLASFIAVWWRNRYSDTVKAVFWPSFWFRFVFLLPAFAPFFPKDLRPVWLILAVVLPSLPQGLASVTFISLMRESVDTKRITDLLSRRFVALNITVCIGVLSFGAWLENVPFPYNYQFMFMTAFVAAMVSLWYVNRVHPMPHLTQTPEMMTATSESPWRHVGFQKVGVIAALAITAFFAVYPIVPLRLVNDMDASEGFIALFGMCELASGALMANLSPYFVKKIGARKSAGLAMVATGIGSLIIAFAPELHYTLLGTFFLGGAWTMADISIFTLFNENTPQGSARFSQSYYQVTAVSLFVGPMIGTQLANGGMDLTHVLIIGACLRLFAGMFALTASPFRRMITHTQHMEVRRLGKG